MSTKRGQPQLRGDHDGNKVLIFSEYKDTALYVAQALEGAGIDNVGLATGDSTDPAEVARRFSPRSNLSLIHI